MPPRLILEKTSLMLETSSHWLYSTLARFTRSRWVNKSMSLISLNELVLCWEIRFAAQVKFHTLGWDVRNDNLWCSLDAEVSSERRRNWWQPTNAHSHTLAKLAWRMARWSVWRKSKVHMFQNIMFMVHSCDLVERAISRNSKQKQNSRISILRSVASSAMSFGESV